MRERTGHPAAPRITPAFRKIILLKNNTVLCESLMTAGRKTPDAIPGSIALICFTVILLAFVYSLAAGAGGTVSPGQNPAPCCICPATTSPIPAIPLGLPAACPAFVQPADAGPAVPEPLASADLVLTRPPAPELVPYTARDFSPPTKAAIAWWMSPGFMDNTTEFRMYLRKNATGKAGYPEEHRVFFEFIESRLDDALQQSVLKNDVVLFRGISPGVAAVILDNAEYREPAFASTSYDITLSLDAFGPRSTDGFRNMIVLERQAGDHALFINDDEREFLLPRSTRWHVVKTMNVENLTIQADFLLHNRTMTTASFDQVRLIYVTEMTCT